MVGRVALGVAGGAGGEAAGAGGEAAGRSGLLCGQMNPQIHPGLQSFRNEVIRGGPAGGFAVLVRVAAARIGKSLPRGRRKLSLIMKFRPVCPVPGEEFPCREEFAAVSRGQLSARRKVFPIMKPAAETRSGAARGCCAAVPGTGP